MSEKGTESGQVKMDNLNILWVAKSYNLPESGVKSHSHPFCHMIYAVDGEDSFCAGKESLILKPGMIALVPKDVKHTYVNHGTEPFNFLEIKFVPSKHFEDLFSNNDVILCEDSLAGELFKKIVFEYNGTADVSDDIVCSYLTALLNLMTESMRRNDETVSKHVNTSGYSALSKRIVEWLEEHFSENVSLDDLAAELDYNKTYLCKAYKNDTETTILDTLNMIRIRHAAELITYSDMSLSQVAAECGFATVSHFNRVFHKYVGITPGQCRRAYPADVLFGPWKKSGDPVPSKPDRFMRSVLAGKTF